MRNTCSPLSAQFLPLTLCLPGSSLLSAPWQPGCELCAAETLPNNLEICLLPAPVPRTGTSENTEVPVLWRFISPEVAGVCLEIHL